MGKRAILGLAFCLLFLLSAVGFAQKQLVVYTYDSFVSYGLAGRIIPKFEKLCGCKVKVVTVGDAGQVLARLILERRRPKADVVVGLDQNMIAKAIREGVLEPYTPNGIGDVDARFVVPFAYRGKLYMTPYDYGAIAIIYNKELLRDPPETFEELLSEKYRKSLIVEDPRTSSTGLSFLLWTIAVYGPDGFADFWRKLKPNIYAVVPGWDSAFGLFEKGEAPMMVSYATDPAYSWYYYKNLKYGAIIFREGGYVQVEGAGIVKGTKNRELAERFIDFLISEDAQKEIPLTQWMFPVNKNVKLPEAFRYAAKVGRVLRLDPEEVERNLEKWLEEWASIIAE